MTLPARTEVPRAEGQPLAVLFVDDDPLVCRSVAKCLARIGFRIETVPSGADALAALGRERFDVLVTDQNMPGMTGAELIGRVMTTDPSWRGRIILTSGDLSSETSAQVLAETGARGLEKPFQVAELILALRAAAPAAASLTAA